MNPDQQELLEQAHRSLEAAKLLFENGYFKDSVSRAYYSMFYVARAFLAETPGSFRTHRGVILAFGRDVANAGRVPVEYHQKLTEAERLRNKADYRYQETITSDTAQEQITYAEQFLELGQRLIAQQENAQLPTPTPQQLWNQYSQGIPEPIAGKEMIEIARRAFQDNLDAETITQMLREAPHFQQVQRSQGPERAREFIRLLVQRAQIQNQLPPEPPHGQERKQGRGPQI